MEAFSISRLDTELGLVRVEGVWDPLTAEIYIQDLALFTQDGWTDVPFWLTEQEHELDLLLIRNAIKIHLI